MREWTSVRKEERRHHSRSLWQIASSPAHHGSPGMKHFHSMINSHAVKTDGLFCRALKHHRKTQRHE